MSGQREGLQFYECLLELLFRMHTFFFQSRLERLEHEEGVGVVLLHKGHYHLVALVMWNYESIESPLVLEPLKGTREHFNRKSVFR